MPAVKRRMAAPYYLPHPGRFGRPQMRERGSKNQPGGVLGCLGCVMGRLGGVIDRLGAVSGRLGGVLGASWGVLGASWRVLRRIGGVVGRLGRLGRGGRPAAEVAPALKFKEEPPARLIQTGWSSSLNLFLLLKIAPHDQL